MTGFVKLHSSILDSSVWQTDHTTRVVWVTLLAMADADGYVAASAPGLAHRAIVTRAECDAALALFLAPDPDSRTRDAEGRRIQEVPGGWLLLNHGTYRLPRDPETRREQNRAAQQRFREKHSAAVDLVSRGKPRKAQAEAEAEAEAEAPPKEQTPLALTAWTSTATTKRGKAARPVDPRAEPVLAKLDAYRVGLGLRPLPPSQRVDTWIVARLDEGVPVSDLLLALDLRAADVQRDPGGLRYFDACSPFTGPGSRGPGGWAVSARMIDEAQRRGKGPTAPGLAPAGTAEAAENYARLVEIERDKDLRAQEAASIAARGGAR